MIRVLSWLTFGFLFLMISPNLRLKAFDFVAYGIDSVVKYSPWSYLGFATIFLVIAMRAADRSSQQRELTRRD